MNIFNKYCSAIEKEDEIFDILFRTLSGLYRGASSVFENEYVYYLTGKSIFVDKIYSEFFSLMEKIW